MTTIFDDLELEDELEEEDIDSLHIYPKWVPVCGENMIFIAAGNTLYALQ